MLLSKNLFDMSRLPLYLYILCFVSFFSAAQAQETLSIEQAISRGLANSYSIKVEETDLTIAQNRNDWAIAGKYPSLNVNLSNSNNYSNINNPVSFLTEINSFSTGLVPSADASLILFDGYRVRMTKKQLEQTEILERGNLAITVENTIQNVMLAYYQALLQQEQLEVLEEVLALSRDRIRYQEARQEFGQAGKFDILQTQDAYLNDSTSYLLQQTNLGNALRTLNQAMGEDDLQKRYSLSDQLNLPIEDYQLGALQEKMNSNNRSIQNAFVGRELANLNTRIVESANYPRISAAANTSYNWNLANGSGTQANGESRSFDAIISKTLNAGVSITASYQLFDWGVRRRNIETARLQEVSTQYSIEDLKRNLNLQMANTFANYQNQRQLIGLTETLVQNARENLEIAAERFRSGQINSFDYRAVQVAFINAEQSRLTSIFNLKTIETDLIRLTGGMVR